MTYMTFKWWREKSIYSPTIVTVATYTAQNDWHNKMVISSFVSGGTVIHDRNKLYILSITEMWCIPSLTPQRSIMFGRVLPKCAKSLQAIEKHIESWENQLTIFSLSSHVSATKTSLYRHHTAKAKLSFTVTFKLLKLASKTTLLCVEKWRTITGTSRIVFAVLNSWRI